MISGAVFYHHSNPFFIANEILKIKEFYKYFCNHHNINIRMGMWEREWRLGRRDGGERMGLGRTNEGEGIGDGEWVEKMGVWRWVEGVQRLGRGDGR